ncbi:MAG: BlaI/MecI/CopY family transcriptional regulator [Candidatus Micrarchaeota archaeon]|nr:BlaI/MecI/CopY family transcriptional regulator [Candidatus Micrarchaeota archaeon]
MKNKQIETFLSPLEDAVLNELFSGKELTTREIFRLLNKKKKEAALTSIAVSLDRLHSSGLVSRRIETCRGGLRYLYKSGGNKEDVYRLMVSRSVDKILRRFGPVASSYFNERFNKGK